MEYEKGGYFIDAQVWARWTNRSPVSVFRQQMQHPNSLTKR